MKNIYPCSQNQLYAVAEAAWNLHLLHIGDFTAFLPKYSVKHFEEVMLHINTTRDIRLRQYLNNDVTNAKNKVVEAKDEMLVCYKSLKEYCKEGGHIEHIRLFKSPIQYRKACNNNWKVCYSIACLLLNFELTELNLEARGLMPAGFKDKCKAAARKYFDAHFKFYMAMKDAGMLSSKKVHYCNRIYTELTAMLRHAQIIYTKNPEMQALFCFDRMLKKQKAKGRVIGEIQPAKAKKPLNFFSKVASMF